MCHAYVVVRICTGRSWHGWCVYVGCVGMFQVTPCGVPPASIRRIIARPTLIVSFSAPLCAPALSMYTTSFRSRFLFCPPCLTAGVLGRVFGTIPRCCVCFRSLTGLRGAAASFRPVPCTETFESCVCGVCPLCCCHVHCGVRFFRCPVHVMTLMRVKFAWFRIVLSIVLSARELCCCCSSY